MDIIYYVLIKKDGSNPINYFIYRKHEHCKVHNSTSCGCKLNMSKEVYISYIKKTIDLYIICSTFFERIDNKYVYVSTKTKIKILSNDINTTTKTTTTNK